MGASLSSPCCGRTTRTDNSKDFPLPNKISKEHERQIIEAATQEPKVVSSAPEPTPEPDPEKACFVENTSHAAPTQAANANVLETAPAPILESQESTTTSSKSKNVTCEEETVAPTLTKVHEEPKQQLSEVSESVQHEPNQELTVASELVPEETPQKSSDLQAKAEAPTVESSQEHPIHELPVAPEPTPEDAVPEPTEPIPQSEAAEPCERPPLAKSKSMTPRTDKGKPLKWIPKGATESQQTPRMEPDAKFSEETSTWTVIAGGEKSGVVVRNGIGSKSKVLGVLRDDATIQEIKRSGNRMNYKKLSGEGPDQGWISTVLSGKATLSRR